MMHYGNGDMENKTQTNITMQATRTSAQATSTASYNTINMSVRLLHVHLPRQLSFVIVLGKVIAPLAVSVRPNIAHLNVLYPSHQLLH